MGGLNTFHAWAFHHLLRNVLFSLLLGHSPQKNQLRLCKPLLFGYFGIAYFFHLPARRINHGLLLGFILFGVILFGFIRLGSLRRGGFLLNIKDFGICCRIFFLHSCLATAHGPYQQQNHCKR